MKRIPKHILVTLGSLAVIALICMGAASISYTVYFYNVNVATNTVTKTLTLNGADLAGQLTNKVLKAGDTMVGTLVVPAVTLDGASLATQLTNKFDKAATQTANTVLAGPTSGGAAAPTMRALVADDIPSLGSLYVQKSGDTMTNATTQLLQLNQGATNTIFASARGGSNVVEIKRDFVTGGLDGVAISHAGPNNKNNSLFIYDTGDDSGSSPLADIPVSVVRRQHAGELQANKSWDQTNKRWNVYKTGDVAASVEVGQEGVTLHASNAAATHWGTDAYAIWQSRATYPRGTGGDGLGLTYCNVLMAPLFAQMEAAAALWRGTSTQPVIWIRNLSEDGNFEVVRFDGIGNVATGPIMHFRKSRGTATTQTIVNSGDFLGLIRMRGYDGAAYQIAADIAVVVDGTPGANDMPGAVVFRTTPDGAVTPVERMRVGNAGNVGVGVNAPTSMLHMGGSFASSIATGTAATLGDTNEVYLVNVDAQTVTLPTAVGKRGRTYTIKTITPAVTATIATTSSQVIDGAATYSLSASNKFVRVISDDAAWWIIGNN